MVAAAAADTSGLHLKIGADNFDLHTSAADVARYSHIAAAAAAEVSAALRLNTAADAAAPDDYGLHPSVAVVAHQTSTAAAAAAALPYRRCCCASIPGRSSICGIPPQTPFYQ